MFNSLLVESWMESGVGGRGQCLVPCQSLMTNTVFPGVWNHGDSEGFVKGCIYLC